MNPGRTERTNKGLPAEKHNEPPPSSTQSGQQVTAFISLGSNLGASTEIVRQAIKRLEPFSAHPLAVSSFWESEPVDCPPGSPRFVNAIVAVIVREGETPLSLLKKLQRLEKEFGRQPKKVLNEPRPLDLDIVAFGNLTCSTNRLVVPHPRAHQRKFVLQPLSELASNLILPGQNKTVAQLLAELPSQPGVRRLTCEV